MKKSLINYFFCVWVFAVISMAFVACDKDDDDNGGSSVTANKVTVTISGLSSKADSVYLVDYTSSSNKPFARAVVKDDKFSIELPTPTNLYSVEGEFGFGEGVTASAPFKFCHAAFRAYKNGSSVGEIYYGNNDDDNEIDVVLLYVDRDATVTGSETNTIYTQSYNYNLKKGWNYVADIYKGQSDGKDIYEGTTSIPEGVKWYFLLRI